MYIEIRVIFVCRYVLISNDGDMKKMSEQDMLWSFLPSGLREVFEVVRVDEGQHSFDVWLDEKREKTDEDRYNNNIIGYGYTPYTTIQDHLTRGKPMFLHLRKCKWQDKSSGEIFSYDIDYYSEDGTQLSAEFVDFLKGSD